MLNRPTSEPDAPDPQASAAVRQAQPQQVSLHNKRKDPYDGYLKLNEGIMRTIALMALAILGGTACQQSIQSKPPLEQGWRPDTETADYGTYPANYVQIIKAWYLANLKDPESARFGSFSKPRKEHAIENQFRKEATFGYSVCASVNAKNSYGGYTGAQTRWFLIRNGSIVRTHEAEYPIYIGRPVNCSDG